jgi:TPP-dependent pyruvate/acetoin dehydrogenase alpha subunit
MGQDEANRTRIQPGGPASEENPMSRKTSPSGSAVARPTGPELGKEIYLDLLRKMLTVDAIEERLKVFVRAGKVSFHASTRGHENCRSPCRSCCAPGRTGSFRTIARRR